MSKIIHKLLFLSGKKIQWLIKAEKKKNLPVLKIKFLDHYLTLFERHSKVLRNWVLIDLSNLKFSTKAVLNQD
jgi:hypothetical protein